MRQTKTELGNELFTYESLAEMMSQANSKDYNYWGGADRYLPTWKAACEAAASLWEEGQKVFQRFTEDLMAADLPEPKDRRRRVRFHEDDGDELDLDRLRSGQSYWRQSTRETCEGPQTVTVIADAGAPARYDSMDLLWRGAAAVALTYVLEQKGFRVELWATTCGNRLRNRDNLLVTACRLKRPEDPLDVSTLINAMSGWYYRTLVFCLFFELCRKADGTLRENKGMSRPLLPEDLTAITTDERRIYSSGVFTQDGALALIRAELEKLTN